MGKISNNSISDNFKTILESHGVRLTPVRLLIFRLIASSSRPISAQEIEEELETVDRSSITRTLSTFSEHHIIHQISDGSGAMRYEMCTDPTTETHKDEHAHFHCIKCGKTYCLTDIPLSFPPLPKNYNAESMTLVITGRCPDCN